MFASLLMAAVIAQTDVRARLDLDPESAEIGQPVTVVLTVSHPSEIEVEWPEEDALLPDDSWVFFRALGTLTTKDPEANGRSLSFARWEVASLEPGARELALADLRWTDGSKAGYATLEPRTVSIAAALAEGEDVARAPRGFRDPELTASAAARWPWFVGGALLVVILLLALRRRKPSTTAADVPQRSARERLDTLPKAEETSAVRETYFELSKLVREVCDGAFGESHAGKTDEEWLEAVAQHGVPAELTDELAALMRRCEEVKYGMGTPTQWALGESIESARALATRVEAHAKTAKESAA